MTSTPYRVVTTSLDRVVDGDTAHHTVAEDWDIRLARVNSPELSTAAGQAAKTWAAQWYADHPGPYTLTVHGRSLDNWGRYICEVVAADGRNLSDDLLAAGQAVPYRLERQLAGLPPEEPTGAGDECPRCDKDPAACLCDLGVPTD